MNEINNTAKPVVVYSTNLMLNGRANFFNDRHQDVSAVEHGNGQQIDDRELMLSKHQKTPKPVGSHVHRIGEHGEDADGPDKSLRPPRFPANE